MKPIYWLLILPLAFFAGQVFIPIQALWPFFLLPFLWAFPASAWAGRSWSARVDVPRGLGLGLLAAVISCAWISHFSLLGGRFVAPDFSRYCGNLAVVMDGEWWAWHEASSLLPAWILSPIAGQVGLMDALAWGALLGFGVTAAACYWWASVLHSRLAGIAAVLFCLCMMPLVVMSRSLTFYPLHVAVFTLATATATVALVRKTKGALLMAGVAIGLALLMDVRGLLFALPAFGAAVLASYKRPLWRTFFRLLLVLAPLTASWHMADRAYPDPSVSLEEQILNLGPYRKARAARERARSP